ncbi:MAG: hypothetical protein C4575_12860 [Desulforudis sp.]|nr:MAG: hypothetical protein C4575_12860 [Desulforudis sp.]
MAGFLFDPENPLERCKSESLRANQALRDYAFKGPGRSLRKLLEQYRLQTAYKAPTEKSGLHPPGPPTPDPPTTRLKTLSDWSIKYQWQERISTWESLLAGEDQHEWARRMAEHRQGEWELRSDLFDLAKAIIAEGPKFLQTRRRVLKDGTEIVTMALDGHLLIKAIDMLSRLGRLSTGMETERQKHEHTGKDGEPLINLDEWLKIARENARQFGDETGE